MGSHCVVAVPSTITSPSVGSRRRLINFSVVVLPQPLRPRRIKVSPRKISIFSPDRSVFPFTRRKPPLPNSMAPRLSLLIHNQFNIMGGAGHARCFSFIVGLPMQRQKELHILSPSQRNLWRSNAPSIWTPASDHPHENQAQSILRTLHDQPRWLEPYHLYDERGSQLFEQICQLPEYYLTRTENSILFETEWSFPCGSDNIPEAGISARTIESLFHRTGGKVPTSGAGRGASSISIGPDFRGDVRKPVSRWMAHWSARDCADLGRIYEAPFVFASA